MILLLLLACTLVFFAAVFGLAWPLAARLRLAPAEQVVVVPALSLLLLHLLGWSAYVAGAPAATLWGAAPLGLLGAFLGRRALAAAARDPDARDLFFGYLAVSAWCLGWLGLVVCYTGGGWSHDWYEHWQRMLFYAGRQSPDQLVSGGYSIGARPPLQNIVTGVLLAPLNYALPYFQVVTLLLGTLAFLPAALLARRFAPAPDRAVIPLVALACLLSPFFVQNATFAWTKLPTAFFTLAGLHVFLSARAAAAPALPLALAGTLLAAALLTHYSAGPYVVALALLWLLGLRARSDRRPALRATVLAAAVAGGLLATWFAWTATHLGGTALATTTTVTGARSDPWEQVVVTLLNLRDTLVPHFLRSPDPYLISQASAWGAARDFFFQSYQLNLFLAAGSVGGLAILRLAWIHLGTAPARSTVFWVTFAALTFFVGVAVHAPRDEWGLAHICLHALILLGLSFLVARRSQLGRGWRLALLLGAAVDLLAGIVLHFAVQGYLVDRWFGGPQWADLARTHYNPIANEALASKLRHRLPYLADLLPFPGELVLALLAAVLMLAVLRCRRLSAAPAPVSSGQNS